MSATSTIGIKLSLDGASQAEASLRRVGTGMEQLSTSAASVRQALGGLAGALAGALSVREFVQAADAVTQLQNNLRLATGSAQAAGTAYQQLFEIAQRSRSNFTELGNTFASITRATESLGLSQRQVLALTETIGNAITVSGASAQASQAALIQLGQGLASGVLRGEELNSILEQTPRLAKALADGLGVSTGALRKLGQEGKLTAEAVVGALRSQQGVLAKEVESSVATVGQAFTQLQNVATVMVGNLDKATGSTSLLAQTVQALAASLGDISSAFKDSTASGSGYADLIGGSIGVALETVAVVGANVAYVIKGIRDEIGGLAAQAVAVATGEFAQAAEIGRLMRADAEKARAEVDALSDRILRARELRRLAESANTGLDFGAENARLARQAGNTVAQPLDFSKLVGGANSAKKAVKELGDEFASQREAARGWADAMGDFAKIQRDTEASSAGLSKAQARLVEYLGSTAYTNASEEMQQLALGQAYAAIEAENLAAALKAENEAIRAAVDAWADLVEAQQGNAQTAQQALDAQLAQNATIGLGVQALAELEAAKLLDTAASKDQRAAVMDLIDPSQQLGDAYRAEAKALRELAAAKTTGAAKQVAADTAKEAAAEWKKASDQIEQSLTDALMRGFESGKGFAEVLRDTVANMFKTLVLRPIISAVVNPVAGAITGSLGLSGTANAGTSALSSIGSLASFSSAFGAGGAAGFGALMGGGFTEAVSAGFTTLLTGGSVGTAAAGLGTLAGALGPIALGIGALVSLSKATKGETRYGGQYGYSFDGTLEDYRRGGEFAGAVQGVNRITGAGEFAETEVQAAITGTVTSINALLKSAGSSAALVGFRAGLETSGKGRGGVFSGGTLSTGAKFGEDGSGDNYLGTLFERTSTQSPDAETALKNFALDLQQATVQALQAATDIPESLKKLVQGVDAEALTADAAAALLNTVQTQINAVAQLNTAFSSIGWDSFTSGAYDATVALAEASGGFDVLAQNLAGYYSNFYTEAERQGKATEQLAAQLAALGQTLPTTRDGFRALVESAEAAGNTTLLAGLLALQDEFAALSQSTDDLAKSAAAAAEAQAAAAEKAAQDAARAADSALSTATAALDAANAKSKAFFDQFSAAVDDAASAIGSASSNIKQFLDGLSAEAGGVGGYNSAAAAFSSQLTLARGGDRDALGGITNYASTLIDAIRRESGSAAEANTRIGRVRGQLAGLPAQVSAEQLIVDAIERQTLALANNLTGNFQRLDGNLDGLLTFEELKAAGLATDGKIGDVIAALDANGDGQISALEALAGTLAAKFDQLDSSLDGALSFDEFRNAFAGMATDATLRQIFSELDINGDGTIARLEAIRGSTGETATNTYGLDKLTRISDVVNSLQWGTTEWDAASTRALATVAGQQGWTADDIAKAIGRFTGQEIADFFAKYGSSITVGGIAGAAASGGTGGTTGTPSTGGGGFVIGGGSSGTTATGGSTGGGIFIGGGYYGALGTQINDPAAVARLDSINGYVNSLDWGNNAAASAWATYQQAMQYGVSQQELAVSTGYNLSDIQALFDNAGVPRFAMGGLHSGGLRLVGENGPELEVTGPSRIYSAADTASLLRSGGASDREVLAELRAMREDNQAQARAIVGLQQRLVKLNERWDAQGLPETRIEA